MRNNIGYKYFTKFCAGKGGKVPELPEVETVRRFLERKIKGERIETATFERPEVLKSSDPAAFDKAAAGYTIAGTGRRGKYLSLYLEKADSPAYELVIHLKMRGDLRVEPESIPAERYLCAALHFASRQTLRFYDMWRWGAWNLFPAGEVSLPGLTGMGLEPFDPDFTPVTLARQLAKRSGPLKTVLLDQRTVAGLGNIYCDESLNRACLHPARSAKSLDAAETERLHTAIVAVLTQAVAQGGAYAERQAKINANIERFDTIYTPQVYDRPGQPCPRCDAQLVKFQLRGRGTTCCPTCQPDTDISAGQETGHAVRIERSAL